MGGDTSVRLSLPLLLAASCFVQLAHFLFGLSTSRRKAVLDGKWDLRQVRPVKVPKPVLGQRVSARPHSTFGM